MFSTIAEIRAANAARGGYWFSRGTMRFFGTRIEGGVIGGRFFVTSEQPPHGPRMFTAREAHDDGRISTIGPHAGHRNRADAVECITTHRATVPA